MSFSIKRFIGLFVVSLSLVSCGKTSKYVSIKDFEGYRYTKWICQENGFAVYVEGKGTPSEGIGFKNDNNTPYFVNFSLPGTVTKSLCSIYNSLTSETEIYNIEKVIKDGKWNGDIHIFGDVDYVMTPVSLKENELDLGFFAGTSFANKGGSITFLFPGNPALSTNGYVWSCTYNQKKIELTFGSNKSFEMKEGTNIASGTYQAGFESATFMFEENNIFDGDEQLEMKYYFGNEYMSFVVE